MKKKSFRFLCILLGVIVSASGAMSAAVFFFDPQNVYRWNTKGTRYFDPIWSAAGSMQHYAYDTLIIGSSMVQNWDAEILGELLSCRPLKVTASAMTPSEELYLLEQARRIGKAKRYIIHLDLHRSLAAETVEPSAGRFPDYMFFPHGVSQFQYLLGFSTWVDFMPVDLVLTVAPRFPFPSSMQDKIDKGTDINRMSSWTNMEPLQEQAWIELLQNGETSFNEGDEVAVRSGAQDRLRSMFDRFAAAAADGAEVKLVLSPYSTAYWCTKTEQERNGIFLLREQLAQAAQEREGVTLLDLQAMPETTAYENYIDSEHAAKPLCRKVEQALADDTYAADVQKVRDNNAQILRNMQQTMQTYGKAFSRQPS